MRLLLSLNGTLLSFFLALSLSVCTWDVAAQDSASAPGPGHGPHAGYVRTVGDYLLELLPARAGKFQLWLLQPTWMSADPTGTSASLLAHLKSGANTPTAGPLQGTCEIYFDGYRCQLPNGAEPKDGDSIEVTVSFKDGKRAPVKTTFSWPLSYLPPEQ